MPSSQILALFNKAMRKISSSLRSLEEEAAKRVIVSQEPESKSSSSKKVR